MPENKLIDFYELTMAYADYKAGIHETKSYFDVFFRENKIGDFSISGGLAEIIEYLQNLSFSSADIEYLRTLEVFDEDFLEYLSKFKFTGNMYAVPDGTVILPNEPCITIHANLIEAKLIETDLLNRFNHGSLITTAARNIVNAADGRSVLEFGARRAQGDEAAVKGAKYAYVGGCVGTSCYEAGKRYGIPLFGTMAHSHVMSYDDEYEAFLGYAKIYPDNCILLVDTYNTLGSGVPNAIKLAQEYLIPNGFRLKGIRLDSGDLLALSIEARKMLDEAGLTDTKITVSNSLDADVIQYLLANNAPIDAFGVGENLITSKASPVFGGVYKLAALEQDQVLINKMKLSDNLSKASNPGYKKVYRYRDTESQIISHDYLCLADETVADYANLQVEELQVPIFKNGNLVYQEPTLEKTKEYANAQARTIIPGQAIPVINSSGIENLKQEISASVKGRVRVRA